MQKGGDPYGKKPLSRRTEVLSIMITFSLCISRKNTYDGVESEMPSEEAASYLLSADTVTDVTYVLGEYKTAEETEKAKSELIAWLQSEAFGVYSMAESKGEV